MSRGTRMESDGLHPRRLWIKAWSEWDFLIVLDEMCWMTVKGGVRFGAIYDTLRLCC